MASAGIGALLSAFIPVFLSACESEVVRKQAEEIRQQERTIKELREENEEIIAARQKQEQKQQACAAAFSRFEKAHAASDPPAAVALYREGLKLCPEDEVAHYELGKILSDMGRTREAREEFEAALNINPNFQGAKQELEKIQNR